MTLFPVAQRELRVAARQPRTYYLRMFTGAVAFVVVGYAAVYARLIGTGTGGRSLFLGLSLFAAWLSLMGGVSATADAISRERREGTLGFLFLSHLSGLDVVLGKLIAQATPAFYALLAVMPLLALPFLDGGVTPGEFWWTMLALTNTLFFSVALGLLTSSLSFNSRQAGNSAVLGAVAFWLGPPAVAGVAGALNWPSWVSRLAYESTPLSACSLVSTPGMSPGRALLFSHLAAWLFLAGASLFAGRAWRERPAGTFRTRWREWSRRLTLGSPATRAARRQRLLERGAFFWLVARHRWKPLLPHLILGFLLGVLVLGWWIEGGRTPPLPLSLILGGTLHLLLKFLVAGEAAGALADHRSAGTLEVLLSTPLTVRDILRSQFRAGRWQFGTPLLIAATLTVGFPVALAWGEGAALDRRALAIALLATAALFADAFTLVWLASWRAIAARRVRHAAGSAVFRVLLLPWLVLLACGPFVGLGSFDEALAFWAVLGFLSDFIWWQWARSQLLSRFRERAGQLGNPEAGGRWTGWMSGNTST